MATPHSRGPCLDPNGDGTGIIPENLPAGAFPRGQPAIGRPGVVGGVIVLEDVATI